jgi:hypothetical protein
MNSILLTLSPGQGSSLGPNFSLTTDVGDVIPNTATLDELLLGKFVSVSSSATKITITSLGVCTNSLDITITTTTTTSTTTSTTTTNSECLLTGDYVTLSPYTLYPTRFGFNDSGYVAICSVPSTPVYGIQPLDFISVPPQLFLDAFGTVPVPHDYVIDYFIVGGAHSIYNYNSSTGDVGAYVTSCL